MQMPVRSNQVARGSSLLTERQVVQSAVRALRTGTQGAEPSTETETN
jgi:hypothetical protein